MDNQVFSVSEFHALLNQTLQFAYPEVWVEGEVSSYKVSQGKWVFFDIKDQDTTISCFLPVFQLKTVLEDGMLVRVLAYPNLTRWGKFSLTVRAIELAGEGSVKKAFEALRLQLEAEGLFATERKRILPTYPQKIALITSAQAAGYSDFCKIVNDRWSGLEIDHAQVQVQGVEAPAQIISAIEYFQAYAKRYDALVIIRGGGSAEDLQAFNDEGLVRALYGSKIPTLVGVGHETDICLAEMVADVRAATPTDAARLLVPDKVAVISDIQKNMKNSQSIVGEQLARTRAELGQVQQNYLRFLDSLALQIAELSTTCRHQVAQIITASQNQLKLQQELLRSLNPTAILQRGYALVSIDGKTIRDPSQVKIDDKLMIQLAKGKLKAKRISDQESSNDQA